MNICEQTQEKLLNRQSLADEEGRHLASCPDCRQHDTVFKRIREVAPAVLPSPTATLRHNISKKVQSLHDSPPSPAQLSTSVPKLLRILPLAVGIVMSVTFLAMHRPSHPRGTSAPARNDTVASSSLVTSSVSVISSPSAALEPGLPGASGALPTSTGSDLMNLSKPGKNVD